MQIGKLEKLASIITGDIIPTLQQRNKSSDGIIYRTGGDLKNFFRYFNIKYNHNTGSRHNATVECLIEAQNLGILNKIVKDIKNDDNAFLLSEFCDSIAIKMHEKAETFEYLQEFENEGREALEEGKYWQVITIARTIIEITLKEICKRFNLKYIEKNIIKALDVVKEYFKMDAKNEDYPDYIKDLIYAVSRIVNNISHARNDNSSSHAPKYKPKKHHAKFVLENAIALSNFLISIMELKLDKKE